MNRNCVLPKLVESFYLTRKEGSEKIKYLERAQALNDTNISGQLLEYYQHIYLKESCFFGNKFFNLELLALGSENRDPNYLGLDSFAKWRNSYQIFAQTVGEDILFCDVSREDCPVYGLISGDNNLLKLSASLFDFLAFYTELTNIQSIEFMGEIFSDQHFNYKKSFLERVHSLMKDFSEDEKAGLQSFILS